MPCRFHDVLKHLLHDVMKQYTVVVKAKSAWLNAYYISCKTSEVYQNLRGFVMVEDRGLVIDSYRIRIALA